MVFDRNGEALDLGVERRSVRHGPGLEYTIELETKIIVQASSGVLLYDEEQRTAPLQRWLRRGLRGSFERALIRVVS
jgi:hypothetical protein